MRLLSDRVRPHLCLLGDIAMNTPSSHSVNTFSPYVLRGVDPEGLRRVEPVGSESEAAQLQLAKLQEVQWHRPIP
jgi:hypothetical protein